MSTSRSVEELLTETLKRAAERAIPSDLHLPFQPDDRVRPMDPLPLDRAGGHTARSRWMVISGVAALVVVALGLTALLGTSPPITIARTQLSAARGQQLLCGAPGCVPVFHAAAARPSQSVARNAGTRFGPRLTAPTIAPYETWIVATNGDFVQVIAVSTRGVNATKRPPSGTLYLSSGSADYYRFSTAGPGPLRVIDHTVHTVTLKGPDGRSYVLNLRTSQLLPQS